MSSQTAALKIDFQKLALGFFRAKFERFRVVHEPGSRTPEKTHELQPGRAVDTGNSVADLLNGLTDRGLLVLILILLAFMYIVSRLLDKGKNR